MPKKQSKPEFAAWHPCDQFIDPLLSKLSPLTATDADSDQLDFAIKDVLVLMRSVHFETARWWFEWHRGLDFADRFASRMERFGNDLFRWYGEVKGFHHAVTNQTVNEFTPSRGGLLLRFQQLQLDAADIAGWLLFLRQIIRQQIAFVNVNDGVRFAPNPIQSMILNALFRAALSGEQLMTELGIGSKETLNGKGGKGGIKELKELGLVTNDRRLGGFYRPDAPPIY